MVPLLQSEIMFQCPLCRQVANLDNTAFLDDEDDLVSDEEIDIDSDERKSLEIMDFDAGNVIDAVDDQGDAEMMEPTSSAVPIPSRIVIPEPSAVAADHLSPSTPKNDVSIRMDEQERAARSEKTALLRSKLIKLSMEFPGFLVQEEVDKLIQIEEEEL